jgi:DNA-binding NarL/FixJ family response regulator
VAELLRIALVASSPLVLAGLQAGLTNHGGFDIVLVAAHWRDVDGDSAADVAVIDVELPADDMPLAADAESGPAIVLLAHDQSPIADWLAAGFAVLPRHASIEQIAAAAQAAACGRWRARGH